MVCSCHSSLISDRGGGLVGLLGSLDGEVRNDLVVAGGDPTDLASDAAINPDDAAAVHDRFDDSWRITDEESLFDYAEGESTETFTLRLPPERTCPGR